MMSRSFIHEIITYQYGIDGLEDQEINALARVLELAREMIKQLPDDSNSAIRDYNTVRTLYIKLESEKREAHRRARAAEEEHE